MINPINSSTYFFIQKTLHWLFSPTKQQKLGITPHSSLTSSISSALISSVQNSVVRRCCFSISYDLTSHTGEPHGHTTACPASSQVLSASKTVLWHIHTMALDKIDGADFVRHIMVFRGLISPRTVFLISAPYASCASLLCDKTQFVDVDGAFAARVTTQEFYGPDLAHNRRPPQCSDNPTGK